MNDEDLTQYQTADGQSTSKKLSIQATTPPADVPGYRLQKFLGAGAFGQVWTGQDLNTGRSVAVKFFLHRSGVNWSLLSREVKNLVQMSADRHVVQVLEVGWESDPPYYVMELVPGGSLEEFLQDRGAIPVAEAVEMFRTICVGLNHCHSKGVLHCDLKPANVLLGDDDVPRLADFGQSRMTHDQTPTLGTLFYMAPEQADLKSTPDSSWDVYAVGAIMYRMLTGLPPYKKESVVDQIDTAGSLPKRLERYREAIAESPPPSGHLKGTGVDRPLARIISRCLAVDPKQRYANVQEILQDLENRDHARSRRPLILLGILGPALLLAASGLFAARTIDGASDSMKQALRDDAFDSNLLAAKFAARNLENEIARYFQLTREEANRTDFREQLNKVLEDRSLTKLRSDLISAGTSLNVEAKRKDVRERLLDHPERIALDNVLQARLKKYRSAPIGSRKPRLATMFVTDAHGTIISIVYDPPVARDRNSAGRNYAYRTYYHAGRDDLDRSTPIKEVQPLTKTHLSSAFPSSATDLWKVAISTPIYFTEDHSKPDAVFVVTINLGDFQLLQGDVGDNHLAVLVEARDGPARGTVLQHPMMENAKHKKRGENYMVPSWLMDELEKGEGVDYIDPLTEDAPDDEDENWIAAMQPVSLPVDDSDDAVDEDAGQADLLVLVQFRLAKVFAPVGEMRSQLLWKGAETVALVLLVMLTLWYFVRRISDRPTNQPKPNVDTVRRDVTETAVAE
ncbi:serine/threonine protein kinase [Planctomycetes bacterium K23_9]|uniref:Serine/threonine-protein kinase PrkC n=1 Tax=Stieleria marina TaxID=1930275 RepID=A0A517NTH0_9BACT|nr:Serine/threonine-protein kinase PrkC [Planctomycetes bacterium K23_9]